MLFEHNREDMLYTYQHSRTPQYHHDTSDTCGISQCTYNTLPTFQSETLQQKRFMFASLGTRRRAVHKRATRNETRAIRNLRQQKNYNLKTNLSHLVKTTSLTNSKPNYQLIALTSIAKSACPKSMHKVPNQQSVK